MVTWLPRARYDARHVRIIVVCPFHLITTEARADMDRAVQLQQLC